MSAQVGSQSRDVLGGTFQMKRRNKMIIPFIR